MIARGALALMASVLLTGYANAQDAIVTYKSLSPELALDLARAALADCRERGYQVAVAVVDRFGVDQVLLRDRFAGRTQFRRRRPRPGRRLRFERTHPNSMPLASPA